MNNQEQNQEQECACCNGTGLKNNLQDINENSSLNFIPIDEKCQHCKGSGKEPQIRISR